MNRSLLFLCCLFSFGLILSCKEKKEVKEEKKQFCLSDTMQHMVQIDSASICPVEDELHLSGEVAFNENTVVKVFPNASGQVTEVKVSLGDKVSKGQVLAIIKSADVAGNYTDLTSANADVNIAKRALDNAASLYKNGISSQREYEEAKENYDKAVATREKIAALISINGGGHTQAGGTYTIVAPASGYVVEKKVNSGNFIRQDMSDNLFTISDLKEVWVWANVFETDIAKIKEGYPVTVTTLAYPDKVYKGTIDKISQVLDPENKALRVKIKLNNADFLLKPEMFANITVTNTEPVKAVCIPSTAVIEDNGKTFVVEYNNNCDLKVLPISVLKVVERKTYISSGVQAGQKLITKNALMIFDQFTDN